jgi:CubicO group peptidase (beta-lactamase class C family)
MAGACDMADDPVQPIAAARRSVQTTGVELPATPAGAGLREYLDMLNSGDKARITEYAATRMVIPPGASREYFASLLLARWRETRGVTPVAVTYSSPTEIHVVLYAHLPELWYSFRFRVEPAAPHRSIPLGPPVPANPPAGMAPPPILNPNEVAADTRRYLRKLEEADEFSGTVLLMKGGHTLVEEAAGYADAGRTRRNTGDTQFNIGSIGKSFTAVAIAQLVEQGKLSYETTLAEALPEYPNREVASRITLHHLLTHTAGLPNYMYIPGYRERQKELESLEALVRFIAAAPPSFPPGARFDYSNSGFIVLGRIVERASGMSYYQYVQRNILDRAGMRDTEFVPAASSPRHAVGMTAQGPRGFEERRFPAQEIIGAVGKSDGGAYSTARDLGRFVEALRTHRLVGEQTLRTLTTGKVEAFGGDRYGYGFFDTATPRGGIFWHGGIVPGGNSQMRVFERGGYTMIVLSNYDLPAADNFVRKVGGVITGY